MEAMDCMDSWTPWPHPDSPRKPSWISGDPVRRSSWTRSPPGSSSDRIRLQKFHPLEFLTLVTHSKPRGPTWPHMAPHGPTWPHCSSTQNPFSMPVRTNHGFQRQQINLVRSYMIIPCKTILRVQLQNSTNFRPTMTYRILESGGTIVWVRKDVLDLFRSRQIPEVN